MSEANELEILRAKKAELEAEARALMESQKSIENRVKTLEEQVAIEELEKNNNTLRETLKRLEAKKAQLENKLKEKTQGKGNPVPEENTTSEGTKSPEPLPAKENSEMSEASVEENLDDTVMFEGIDPDSLLENEEIAENQEKPQEKKKHRFL
jgi:hypothetical protein